MGLFDRPAELEAVKAVIRPPVIEGLNRHLGSNLDDSLRVLRAARLMAPESHRSQRNLDTHPLVREHFGTRLREAASAAWQAAQERLYRYFAVAASDLPDTIEAMEPLFRAVFHGCAAMRHQEVLHEIYVRRIRRGDEGYSVRKLGAIAADLATLAWFFAGLWSRPHASLTQTDQAGVLGSAGFDMRALGRLEEAVAPMAAALELAIQQRDWKDASILGGNFSELLLIRGRLDLAESCARKTLAHADRSRDKFQGMSKRTTPADILHQRGRLKAARALFVQAERMQVKLQPGYPFLYALQGYQYGDLLLSEGHATEARRRAEWMVETRWTSLGLLSIALHHLLLGRAVLATARGPAQPDFALATQYLDAAVADLRKAGAQEFIFRGLFARAALHRTAARFVDAHRDLDTARIIAERGGMRLHLCDFHLESARLHLAEHNLEAARHAYEIAKSDVEAMGYHRRDPELAALAAALAV